MAVISIVGTSGVGKSFLIKQLASLNCLPAFFEGEEGTISKDIFKSIFTNSDPTERFRYFMNRYSENLIRAHAISKLGFDVFVDGSVMTAYAIMKYEELKCHDSLKKIIDPSNKYEADLIVLITSSPEKIKEQIIARARQHEDIERALERALKIQDNLLDLAKKRKNVLIINREKLDFQNEKDLGLIDEKIKKKLV